MRHCSSPQAHALIKNIDASKAKALQGVHAVLTYKDVARVIYASGGQSYPNPPPYDQVSLDSKVRFVGDRVAVVAAESQEIANAAIKLIEVDYEILPAVFDPDESLKGTSSSTMKPTRKKFMTLNTTSPPLFRRVSAISKKRLTTRRTNLSKRITRIKFSKRPSSRTSSSPIGMKMIG